MSDERKITSAPKQPTLLEIMNSIKSMSARLDDIEGKLSHLPQSGDVEALSESVADLRERLNLIQLKQR